MSNEYQELVLHSPSSMQGKGTKLRFRSDDVRSTPRLSRLVPWPLNPSKRSFTWLASLLVINETTKASCRWALCANISYSSTVFHYYCVFHLTTYIKSIHLRPSGSSGDPRPAKKTYVLCELNEFLTSHIHLTPWLPFLYCVFLLVRMALQGPLRAKLSALSCKTLCLKRPE